MNKILLYTLLFLSNSLFASDINDKLADNCGRYAKVLTKDYVFSKYIKSSDRNVRKILIRDIVSPEDYRSEITRIEPKDALASLKQSSCFLFYPVESKLIKNFNKKEALFIHYDSKYISNSSVTLEAAKENLRRIDEEALVVLSELKEYAQDLSLNYIVVTPAIKRIDVVDGKETVRKMRLGKDYKFYTYDYKHWLQE